MLKPSLFSKRDRPEYPVRLWLVLLGILAFAGGTYASHYGPNGRGEDFCDQVNRAAIADDTKLLDSALAAHSVSSCDQVDRRCLENAFRVAASLGHEEIISKFLAAGMDPNACTPAGGTALMHIAGHPHSAAIARLLIAAGADVNLRDKNGQSAADHAMQEGDSELIQVLQDQRHEMKQ
ncbi:MAG TPA: ankyrin repeat domain-containing protein [Tepidisphaeraceae bacterium]|jgi:ankyrin repeat protein|nr:ankyrin repeat domain-containing protein [Tepidisphaeraceae bacterium]